MDLLNRPNTTFSKFRFYLRKTIKKKKRSMSFKNCAISSLRDIVLYFQLKRIYCLKKIRRCYGKTTGIRLPVHIPLFLRTSTWSAFTGAYKITGNGLEPAASYLTVKSADVFAVYVGIGFMPKSEDWSYCEDANACWNMNICRKSRLIEIFAFHLTVRLSFTSSLS